MRGPLNPWHKFPVCRTSLGSLRNGSYEEAGTKKGTSRKTKTKQKISSRRVFETNNPPFTAKTGPYRLYSENKPKSLEWERGAN